MSEFDTSTKIRDIDFIELDNYPDHYIILGCFSKQTVRKIKKLLGIKPKKRGNNK